VKSTAAGYTGGTTVNPTYELVCSGSTKHAEAVQVEFDPKVVSYEKLVRAFFKLHNPTIDKTAHGGQYRSAIFYHSPAQLKTATKLKAELETELGRPVATEITPASTFYRAEEYHQNYLRKARGLGGCRL